MKKKASKGISLSDRLRLFFTNYEKLHQAAVTHPHEGIGRTAVDIIAGSKVLSEWDKSHYFGDTAIFAPHLSVAEEAWGRIESGNAPEMSKLERAKFVASFSEHEPVAIDALGFIEKSEIGEEEKVRDARYIGAHTTYLSVAKRTLNLILRSRLGNERKIPYIRELARLSKHKAVRSKAAKWLDEYKIIKA